MLPNWPISVLRGFPQKADSLLDTTCFSTIDFNDLDTESHSPFTNLDSENLDYITIMQSDIPVQSNMEAIQQFAAAQGSMRPNNRYLHPHLPPSTFLTTLTQPERFAEYIDNEYPSTVPQTSILSIDVYTTTGAAPQGRQRHCSQHSPRGLCQEHPDGPFDLASQESLS